MTDVETGGQVSSIAGIDLALSSTPLWRVAGRLQAALPPGWRVDIVDAPPGHDCQPVLRVVMPEE
ncbi:hypothetical protein [Nocardia australiensis]|uniref:hypothetical protein n=1 Tax=Nocardia australiensis TaxID=2887191 RepID=UPI001D13F0EB|nr:hypothetical protein [Nocardia australiensis]